MTWIGKVPRSVLVAFASRQVPGGSGWADSHQLTLQGLLKTEPRVRIPCCWAIPASGSSALCGASRGPVQVVTRGRSEEQGLGFCFHAG